MESGQRLKVSLPEVPVHETFVGSIAAGAPRAMRGKRDTERLGRGRVSACTYSGSALDITLSTGRTLTIALDGSVVEWQVVDSSGRHAADHNVPSPLLLEFPSGDNLDWSWLEVLDSMVNKEFVGIFASDAFISIGIRGLPDLLFQRFDLPACESALLFFDPE